MANDPNGLWSPMTRIGYGEPPKWCTIVALVALDDQWAHYWCRVTTEGGYQATMEFLATTNDTMAGPEPLSDYLRAIGHVPLLSAGEGLALAQRVVAGDPKAGPAVEAGTRGPARPVAAAAPQARRADL